MAQTFFSSYGGEYQQLRYSQGALYITFYNSESNQKKDFTFEDKQCFKKIAENKYAYQKIHNTWSVNNLR